jgi:hypothetical protein
MAPVELIRRVLPYTTAAVVVAALYSGWIMYSRYSAASEAVQRVEQQNRRREIENGRQIESYLGDELKILSFAADKAVTTPGGRILLCYGVANAASVKIEPELEPVRPAVTHCLEAFPKRTTTYTLTATDANGKLVDASLQIAVR